MLYPEEKVIEADRVYFEKAIVGLRVIAFAGRHRRHEVAP